MYSKVIQFYIYVHISVHTHTHTCGSDSKESAMWETQVRSLGQEDTLEKGMATHTRILAWRIPWTERSLADYRPWGCKYLDTHLTLSQTYIYPYTHTHTHTHIFMCVCDKSLRLCLTVCDHMDCSPPGSSVRGILQARILE